MTNRENLYTPTFFCVKMKGRLHQHIKRKYKRICLVFLTWELVVSQQQRLTSDLCWLEQSPRPDGLETCRGQRDAEVVSLLRSAEWISKTKGKLRNLTHENRSQLRYTLHSYKQKWTVVERLNLKDFFLFKYSDINYITTTREIKNSSFLYTMNVSNRRKGRKVTKHWSWLKWAARVGIL